MTPLPPRIVEFDRSRINLSGSWHATTTAIRRVNFPVQHEPILIEQEAIRWLLERFAETWIRFAVRKRGTLKAGDVPPEAEQL
jgi:hypothetical protein